MKHTFHLESGATLVIEVAECADCTTVSQLLTLPKSQKSVKKCTVTCHSTGKSKTWTCKPDKNCFGDCTDPDNPKGKCV